MEISKFMKKRGINEYTIDGAVNFDVWQKEKYKTLFLLKENYGYQGCGIIKLEDHIYGWLDSRIKTIVNCMTLKIALDQALYKGSKLDDLELKKIFKDAELLKKNLEKTAFINVKKHSGRSQSSDVEIRKESRENHDLLACQIKELKPTIIITGGTVCWHSLTLDLGLFPNSSECPKNTYVKENGVSLFHLNHPSARGYNLLNVHELMFDSTLENLS